MNMTVVPFNEKANVVDGLRKIAKQIEDGEFGDVDEATVVFPGASELFHLGGPDADSGASALLNCSCAITKITTRVLDVGGFPCAG